VSKVNISPSTVRYFSAYSVPTPTVRSEKIVCPFDASVMLKSRKSIEKEMSKLPASESTSTKFPFKTHCMADSSAMFSVNVSFTSLSR